MGMQLRLSRITGAAVICAAIAMTTTGVASAAAVGDACKLLTPAQVQSVLGVAVDAGTPSIPGHPEHCIWREQGKDHALAKNVQVSLLTESQYEIGKTPLPTIPKIPESGMGDEAYFAKTPGVRFTLSVKKGGTYFLVQARPIEGFSHKKGTDAEEKALDEKYKTVERTIAHEVLSKI